MSTAIVKKKKVISSFDKLIKRINREFPKKKYIGDININDEEYELLVKYAKITFYDILNKDNHIIFDSIFATTLVQIGIRHYDGNYWSNFARELNIIGLKSHQQTWIGESFIHTLKSYNKFTLGMNQKVNTILMHGFVSDKFSERFFDFLYKYYSIDLERDIERLDAQLINSLVEVMIRNDNRDRTNMLVSQTADALRVNPRGSKIRIRRWLKLIDKCFWDREIPKNICNRFNNYFIDWAENSLEFNNDYKYVYNGEISKYRNKSFTFPYLMCDLENTIFYLVLPKQLIKDEESEGEGVHWIISIGEEKLILGTELYEAITGYKTEKQLIEIELKHLFHEIIIELRNADSRIRRFKINQDSIRFFNPEGINIKTDTLGVGSMYSFSKEAAITDALIESQALSGITFSYYEFQKGDIIKLPDGKPISIGKKIEEGLMQRGLVDKVFVIDEEENIIVYKSSPSVLIKMNESKVNGTLININGKVYRFSDIEANIIDLQDRSGELGYLFKLSELVNKDGIYEIYIDVPNDRSNRYWKFALINNLSFKFDGSPYIFKTRGTISFAEDIRVIPKNKEVTIISGENSYKFPIIPGNFDLMFDIDINNNIYTLCFPIPVFAYRFDFGEWQVEKPLDIWHSNFPQNISIIYPNDTITLKMENNDLDSEIEQSATYRIIKEKGYIDCDVIRFNSWFSRNENIKTIYLDLDEKNKNIEFINVITKSVLLSNLITYDPLKELLIGRFEIAGCSNYYIDVEFEGKRIIEKQRIIDGKIEIKSTLNSGTYQINIYEDEDDDSGFGVNAYQLVDKVLTELINPYDLQGKSLVLKTIKKGHKSIFSLSLSKKYIIQDLKRIYKDDYNNYYGKLVIDGKFTENYVNVRFNDLRTLNYCYIYFKDEYDDEVEFLFDDYCKTIEYVEEEGLKASERYRRYDSIFEDDYFYMVEFLNENKNAKNIKRTRIIKRLQSESTITLD